MSRPRVVVEGASARRAPARWGGYCDLVIRVEPIRDGYEASIELEHEPGDPSSRAVLACGEPGRTKGEAIAAAFTRLAHLGVALLDLASDEPGRP